jgi:hypothetical protein
MIRKRGMTKKLSLINMRTLSVDPPLYPASIATGTAIILDIIPAIRAMIRELRTAKQAVQKISIPLESVPSGFSNDGGRSLGTSPQMVGSYGEKKERLA